MIKAVLFDFDGVIADSQKLHSLSWIYALKEVLHIETTELPKEKMDGKSPRLIAKTLCSIYNGTAKDEALLVSKNKYLSENLHKIERLPGVQEMFNALNTKSIPFGIASNASRNYVKACLSQWNLEVKHSFGYEDYQYPKPNPEPYLKLAKCLHIQPVDFKDILVFEDSETGLIAAKDAGMKVVHIASHCKVSPELLNRTDHRFRNLLEAIVLLD